MTNSEGGESYTLSGIIYFPNGRVSAHLVYEGLTSGFVPHQAQTILSILLHSMALEQRLANTRGGWSGSWSEG